MFIVGTIPQGNQIKILTSLQNQNTTEMYREEEEPVSEWRDRMDRESDYCYSDEDDNFDPRFHEDEEYQSLSEKRRRQYENSWNWSVRAGHPKKYTNWRQKAWTKNIQRHPRSEARWIAGRDGDDQYMRSFKIAESDLKGLCGDCGIPHDVVDSFAARVKKFAAGARTGDVEVLKWTRSGLMISNTPDIVRAFINSVSIPRRHARSFIHNAKEMFHSMIMYEKSIDTDISQSVVAKKVRAARIARKKFERHERNIEKDSSLRSSNRYSLEEGFNTGSSAQDRKSGRHTHQDLLRRNRKLKRDAKAKLSKMRGQVM